MRKLNQYAVKFVCGDSSKLSTPCVVVPGRYTTVVNIHNPWEADAGVDWKFALAYPAHGDDQIPSPTWFPLATLKPDGVAKIDCQDVTSALKLPTNCWDSFIEGFVVLRCPYKLDVVALYTAGREAVTTMHVETVQPKQVVWEKLVVINLEP